MKFFVNLMFANVSAHGTESEEMKKCTKRMTSELFYNLRRQLPMVHVLKTLNLILEKTRRASRLYAHMLTFL